MCMCTVVCVLTGEFLEEGGHVVWFVKARPHLGQHLHVFYHQFLHGHKHQNSYGFIIKLSFSILFRYIFNSTATVTPTSSFNP